MARVVIGLSGGVDSSVAAWLLKQQGHEVVGLFMINWHDTTGTLEGDCPWHDDRVFAELVARRLDIPLHVVDLSEHYRSRVVDYMFAEYARGRTPNPDVLCNREIKFDVFLREALRLGADYVATGHYCRKEERRMPDGSVVYRLLAGSDPNKDQSYFLCQLSQEQLRRALFPVGDLLKPEVRRIAAEQQLATARRKDSQGICFLGKVNYNDYLRRYLGERPGDVLELETGKRIGSHRGLWFHTIGQRHGLGFGGGPWYAVKKDVERNILYVSHGFEPRTAYRQDFPIHDFHFLTMPVDMQRITFKIRHTPEYHPAVLEQTGPGSYIVHAEQPIQGVAPGQFCVVYDERHHRCYGSGEITV